MQQSRTEFRVQFDGACRRHDACGMAGVFISYRRDEEGDRAKRLHELLLRRLGPEEVFIDVDMEFGLDFHERLGTEAGRCNVMLAVIGRAWSDVEADGGGRALDNPRDWVRME